MKKFIKKFFLFCFILIFILILVFYKRLILTYNIADKYFSLKNNIDAMTEIDSEKLSNSMNYKDIIYKNTNDIPLTLDIYSPLKQVYKSSPVIIYVHGGSWAYGDKNIPDALGPVLDTFREQGYTIISTSYELMKEKENFYKQVSDVKDTIRWINKNKSIYNIDPNEIGVIGFSSGAHLSLLAAYSDDSEFIDDENLSSYSSKIKYLIDVAGPTDLSLLNTENLNYDLSKIFSSIENKDDLIKRYNPINYVSKTNPETLIIHSDSDNMVPYKSSQELYEKCMEINAKAKLITLNGTNHDLSSISQNNIIDISKGLLKFVIFNSPL